MDHKRQMTERDTIVICGGGGQLASAFVDYFKKNQPLVQIISLREDELDVARDTVQKELQKHCPTIVINTAASHNLDECQDNPTRAYEVNSWGGYAVAKAAQEIGAKYLFISSGYVFDGAKKTPYSETDTPNPRSIYAHSKLLAERLIRVHDPTALIVRTNALFGIHGERTKGAGNFIDFVSKSAKEDKTLRMVSDQHITPTSCSDLASACVALFSVGENGIYHVTNSGETTWFDVAVYVYQLLGSRGVVLPISTTERKARSERPLYNILSTKKFEKTHKALPHWQDAVAEYARIKGYLV